MSESGIAIDSEARASMRIPAAFLRACCLAAVALLVGLIPARADEQETEYLRIYENIQQADSLDVAGQTAAAMAKYQQAHADLVKFRKAYPNWRKDMVSFRMNYVAQKAAACNDKLNAAAPAPGTGASSTNAGPQTQGQPKAGAPAAEVPPVVTLLEPGAEPRKELRLHPKAGEKQTVTLTVQTSFERKAGGGQDRAEAMKAPPLLITLESTIKDVSAEGDITYENVIADASAGEEAPGSQPGLGAAMNAAFANLKGLTTSGVLSSRGFSKRKDPPKSKSGGDGQQPPAAARFLQGQMEASFTMLTAPLPEEPVGAGAKWEVKMVDKATGIAKAVYEIVSIEGERVAAKTTVTLASNPAEAAKTPELGKMKVEGKGQVTIDLTRIMPADGELEQTMDFGGGGQGQPMSGKILTNLHIESK